jgi:hypothetical protein
LWPPPQNPQSGTEIEYYQIRTKMPIAGLRDAIPCSIGDRRRDASAHFDIQQMLSFAAGAARAGGRGRRTNS